MIKTLPPKRKTPVHLPIMFPPDRPAIVFITVCTQNRKPILARPEVHRLLVNAWKQADTWAVGRYVIMPDHLHLFCAPAFQNAPPLNRWVQYWKTICSRAWPRPSEQPIWQKSFWDRQLRSCEHYASKWDYVRRNPIRASLCALPEEWPYQGRIEMISWNE
jgi:putative transposase